MNRCADAVARDFLNINNFFIVDIFPVGRFQRERNGMIGITLNISGKLQQFFFGNADSVYLLNLEHTFCKGSCFVKHNDFSLRQCFQIVTAFDKNTAP
ncbi:hypothetical protein SDC9_148854 [bioreactor metagenome]|uniref:Uncharacterized protein n=1 Tax=bioreactor metagenome TaxID=1076179 RepID=A0A645ELV0_9ZZZZ